MILSALMTFCSDRDSSPCDVAGSKLLFSLLTDAFLECGADGCCCCDMLFDELTDCVDAAP